MSNAKYDAETTEQLSRAAALEQMFSTPGWKYAEEELNAVVAELKDISTIDLQSDAAQQIRDRKNLAEGLLEWVESLKSQVNNAIIITEEKSSTLMTRR